MQKPAAHGCGRVLAEEPTVTKTPYRTGPVNRKLRFLSTGRSLFATKNWRLTFRIDKTGIEMIDLDNGDYHQEVAMNAIKGIRTATTSRRRVGVPDKSRWRDFARWVTPARRRRDRAGARTVKT
jgi:hypothetical protein